MNKKFVFPGIVVIVAAILIVSTSVALAAPPLGLHIEVTEYINTSGEAFAASGPAVDAGIVCASGTVNDVSVVVNGNPSSGFRTLHVLKRFNCNGGGTFDVKMKVRLDLTTNATTARWNIVSGTGAYAGLKGNGSLVGNPIVPGTSILDVYDGKAH